MSKARYRRHSLVIYSKSKAKTIIGTTPHIISNYWKISNY
jgi:hypothetical protein